MTYIIKCLSVIEHNELFTTICKERRIRNSEIYRETARENKREHKGKTSKGTLSEPRVHSNLVCPTSLTFFRSVSGSTGSNISALFTCLVRPQQPAAKLGHNIICTSKHLHNSQPHTGGVRKPHCKRCGKKVPPLIEIKGLWY